MAELRLIETNSGDWRTRAIWSHDGPVLLPVADEVQIGDAICPWAEVEPHLTAESDYTPIRWSAERWPQAGR